MLCWPSELPLFICLVISLIRTYCCDSYLFCSKALAFKYLAKKKKKWGLIKAKLNSPPFFFSMLIIWSESRVWLSFNPLLLLKCQMPSNISERGVPISGNLLIHSWVSLEGQLVRHDALWGGQQALSPCIFLVLIMDIVCQAAWHVWFHR